MNRTALRSTFHLLLCALAFASRPSVAQDRSVQVSSSVRYDDNILRTPAAAQTTTAHDGADVVGYLSAQAHLGTAIGGVAASVDANAGHSFYLWNGQFDAFDYGGRLSMEHTGERSSASLIASYVRRPIDQNDVSNSLTARQGLAIATANVSRAVLGDFRVVGLADYRRNSTSLPGRRSDSDAFLLGGGLGYYSPSGSIVSLEYREVRTKGINAGTIVVGGQLLNYDSRSTDRTFAARIDYNYSIVTQLQGQIGYTRHDDRSVLDADFKGITADMRLNWSPREAFKLSSRFARSFGSENSLYSNGVAETTVRVDASGLLGRSMQWNAYWSRQTRKFRYDVNAPSVGLARRDRIGRMGARIDLVSYASATISLGFERSTRNSTLASFDYNDNAATLAVSRRF